MSTTDRMRTEQQDASSERSSSSKSLNAPWLTRLLREPLLHFLVLGAALFLFYGYLNADQGEPSNDLQIVVTEGKIEHLAALFTRTWQRPPTREELQALVDDYTREEAAYREGVAMGLDRNDTIIRRRIRQKLDFVAEDLANQRRPTNAELEEFLRRHANDFHVGRRLTFRHVFFNPEKHGQALSHAVAELIVRLEEDPSIDAREQGDRTLLSFRYENVSRQEVANLFGDQFAGDLIEVEPQEWQGPLESPYGLHAVIVDELTPGRVPPLDEIRDSVLREWEHARRQTLTEEYYRGLLKKYDVVIRWPDMEAEL